MIHGLSSRERDHQNWLMEQPDEAPSSSRPTPASTIARPAEVIRHRDRDNAADFIQTTALTPSEQWDRSVVQERAKNAALAAKHKARRDHEAKVAEYARLKKESDAKALREHRQALADRAVQDDIRKDILATLNQYDCMGRLDEVMALVKAEGLGMANTDAWRAVCQNLAKK
jgi:hypothetical protein